MWCGCCGRVDTCLGSFVLLLSYGLFIFLNTDNCYSLFLRFIKTHKSFLGTKDIFPPPPPPPHKSYYYTNEESIQTKLLEHSLFWQQPIESPHAMLLWEPARKLMTVVCIWRAVVTWHPWMHAVSQSLILGPEVRGGQLLSDLLTTIAHFFLVN